MPVENCHAGNYSRMRIYKALVQFYKIPEQIVSQAIRSYKGQKASAAACRVRVGIPLTGNQRHCALDDTELYFNARMPLYAISRARV